jgi:hypothetical protein
MPAAVPGTGHARGLRQCGLKWARLRRLASGGSWCGMRLFLSRKVGGLIAGTCGLGGPHYGLIGYAMLPVIGLNR